MQNLVNHRVKDSSAELYEQFVSAQPFRHISIDDFLDEKFAMSLLATFPAFDEKLAINENGELGGKAVQQKVTALGPVWQQLDTLVKSAQFREMISEITGIPRLKFDPDYYGGGTHENLHGQSLNPHVDFNFHPRTNQHRRMNLILYLSPEWEQEWGGSIQLHRDPYKPPAEDDIVTITPVFNRCVIFETNEYSWHGFESINLPEDKRMLSRKSFALYYYTDDRPAEELGAEHSTIYVERHLPEDIQAGTVLSAEQLQQIQGLLTHRDQHLKRLYKDIQKLNTDLNFLRRPLPSDGQFEDLEFDPADSVELTAMKNRVAGLQGRILEYENSTSWRMTKPLRALKVRLTGQG